MFLLARFSPSKITDTYEEEIISTLTALAICATPFVLLGYFVFFNVLPKAARALGSYSSSFKEAYKGESTGDSFGRDNVQLVGELLDGKPPNGTYFAMGDRAGSFGYFLGNRFRFLHTEGLVGPYEYLVALRQDAGDRFIQSQPIDYLVVDRGGVF